MKKLEKILRENDLKITKGRMEVMQILYKSRIPLCAEEVYSKLSDKSSPGFTSLYRILNQLTAKGILKRSLHQNGIHYYEFSNDRHRHFIICSNCGKMQQLETCPLEGFEEEVANSSGYMVTNHSIELEGLCPKCRMEM